MDTVTGQTLIAWGVKPGAHFREAIATANRMQSEGADQPAILAAIQALVPVTIPMRPVPTPYFLAINAETEVERTNVEAVIRHMDELMRVPTIRAGAVMPDACPCGSAPGTIPVGGVVACEDAIHPGFHSADICCSVAITVLTRDCDLRALLDAVQAVTHFGPGGRRDPVPMPPGLNSAIGDNALLADLTTPTDQPAVIHLDGATHEMLLYALDPAHTATSARAMVEDGQLQALSPPNHGYQFKAETDAAAVSRLQRIVDEIEARRLSPDTDFRQAWDVMFRDAHSLRK